MYIKSKFIISVVFILVCGFFILMTPEMVNAQNGSNCCFDSFGMGCDNQVCEDAVCAVDPFCCDANWDSVCANEAAVLCEVCGGGGLQFTLTPRTAVNPVSTEHTVTATVLEDGVPNEGVEVDFEVLSGPNEGDDGECTPEDCMTDANGQVTWTYSGSEFPGTDTIQAEIELIPSNTVEKEWIVVRNIPALSGWGFIIIAGLLGIAAVIVLKKKKTLFKA